MIRQSHQVIIYIQKVVQIYFNKKFLNSNILKVIKSNYHFMFINFDFK